MVKSKSTPEVEIEEFPFNNQYYDLITGKTISKRGVWWTALLVVQSKGKGDEPEEEKKETNDEKPLAKKVIIQRWRRFKQGEDGFRWGKSKDFTISSKNQWNQLKNIIDEWLINGTWE
jgi:hypothetical protein